MFKKFRGLSIHRNFCRILETVVVSTCYNLLFLLMSVIFLVNFQTICPTVCML